MTTKSEWQDINRQLRADQRKQLGARPDADEMLAYSRGELPEEEEARVRQWIAADPELLRAQLEPFPIEGARPGDPDYLSDAEYESHFAALQKQMQKRMHHPRVEKSNVNFWRVAAAIAASVAVALGVLLWQARARVTEPRLVWEQQVLFPDGQRGPARQPAIVAPQGESVLLAIPLIGERGYERYRLELLRSGSQRAVWRSGTIAPPDDDTFTILVPRRFFDRGAYHVAVYGVTGAAEERLATYSLLVPASRP